MRSVFPHFVALALGAAAAVLVSCGSSTTGLIPASRAQSLDGNLQSVSNAVDAGNCTSATKAVAQVADAVYALTDIDPRLEDRLVSGVGKLNSAVATACGRTVTTPIATHKHKTKKPPKTTTTTATDTTPTTATDTTPTTPTDTTPTDTIPTDTTPTDTTPTETATNTSGGVTTP